MPSSAANTLHPQYRLLLLLLLAVLLPQLELLALALLQCLLLLACFRVGQLNSWWQSFLRLKWLLISIAVLYGWFTPGLPIVEVVSVNMPTREGLWLALSRTLLLASLVAAVTWLVKPLSASVLAVALTRLLSPLAGLGLNIDVFAKRLALTLNAVSELQVELDKHAKTDWQASLGRLILLIEKGDFVADEVGISEPLPSPQGLDALQFVSCALLLGFITLIPGLL